MKIDAGLPSALGAVPARARALEAAGYDGAITAEVAHDPFLPLLLAAEHSERLELATSIAVAFARSPMQLAQIAHDLNAYSQGRFILGLGSQIRAHVTRRFGMPWSHPARRMRELIQALRAIWACWYDGRPLEFRGEFYTHTLMTPAFTPQNREHGAPRVFLAAVGPRMTEVAAEVADGMIAHPFTTERYLREVTLPAIERGLARSGKTRAQFTLCCPPFIALQPTGQQAAGAIAELRQQIAFYGSTPAYRGVLELHGWEGLQDELNTLAKRGQWGEMGARISDDVLGAFAVIGPAEQIEGALRRRYLPLLDRITLDVRGAPAGLQQELAAALRAAEPAGT